MAPTGTPCREVTSRSRRLTECIIQYRLRKHDEQLCQVGRERRTSERPRAPASGGGCARGPREARGTPLGADFDSPSRWDEWARLSPPCRHAHPRPLVTARPPDPSFLRVMMDRAVFILCKNCESASEVWVPVPARPCLGAAGPEMRGAAGGGRGAAAGAPWPGPSWGPAGRPCRPHPSCRRSWEGPAAGSSGSFALPSRGRGRAGKEPRLDPCQAQTMTGENEVETLPTARSSFSTGESVPPAAPLSPLPGGARADGRAPAPGRRQPGPHERSRPT